MNTHAADTHCFNWPGGGNADVELDDGQTGLDTDGYVREDDVWFGAKTGALQGRREIK